MGGPARHRAYTYAEYLALEQETGLRHEWLDGEAWAMSGGTPRHSRMSVNLAAAFVNTLGDGPCQPYNCDMKVRVSETGLATYPDLAIACGPVAYDPEDENAVVNPTVLVEVPSRSTAA